MKELQKEPILYLFSPDFLPCFEMPCLELKSVIANNSNEIAHSSTKSPNSVYHKLIAL